MGILTLAEDRPTPKSVYNWRVYALAGIASCGSNMIGYTSAFIGTTITLASFRKEFGIDEMSPTQQSLISENIVSLFIAGAFFGALGTYALGHFIGRKWSLAVAATVFFLGAGLQLGANSARGLGILYAGRVLSGVGTGVASNIIPIYLSELSPPAIRGRLVGLYELGWQIGGMLGFWINVRLPPSRWSLFPPVPSLHSKLTRHGSMVLSNTCLKTTNNGSSPSPFNSSRPVCFSWVPCGSRNLLVGCSSRTVAAKRWIIFAGFAN